MDQNQYWDNFPSAVTICNTNGIIIYMNHKSASTFEKYGGFKLLGQSLFNCHNPHSVDIIKSLIAQGKSNSYTIQKDGRKKLIHQSPWYLHGQVAGLIEISIELPENMVHHNRD